MKYRRHRRLRYRNRLYLRASDDSALTVYGPNDSHRATHQKAWIYDSGAGLYVPAYFAGATTDAPGGNPCSVQMASDPGGGVLEYSAFDDDFNDSAFDTCRHTTVLSYTGAVTEGEAGVELTTHSSGSYGVAGVNSRCPVSGDFDVSLSFSGIANFGNYVALYFSAVIGGQWYGLGTGDVTAVPGGIRGVWRTIADAATVYTATVPTEGTFRIVRTGTSMELYYDAVLIHTATVPSTAPSTFRTSLEGRTPNSGTVATVAITNIAFA